MYRQSIFGIPRKCLNRACRQEFYKQSHLGWLPKSETEVFSVMRCPKCKDTFLISQIISSVYEYKDNLPNDPLDHIKLDRSPISQSELDKVKQALESTDVLKSLYEGYKPGAANPPPSE